MTPELNYDTPFELDIKPSATPAKTNKKIKYVDGRTYEYELYPLVDEFDPVLKEPTEFFNFDNPVVEPKYLALSLLETMKSRHGIGLAAPQIGLSTRVFVLGAEDGVGYSFFNPVVIETKGEVKMDEGCLSYPGLYLSIKRAAQVTVSYFDFTNTPHEKTFTGLTARVLLHELDHLDGTCFTTLVSPIKLNRAKEKVKKNLKLLKVQRAEYRKNQLVREAMKSLYMKSINENEPTINIT